MNGNPAEISLYFHIPFCTRKCDYCHFFVLPDQEPNKDRLLLGFKNEWHLWLPAIKNKKIVSIYFGGGTPSLFGPHRIETLLDIINSQANVASDVEITLEANPDGLSFQMLKDYASAGINRLSIGIQTLDDDLLKLLGRLHNAEMAIRAVDLAAEVGFSRISVDLMYDLPKQKLTHWENTLDRVGKLPISHLSLYNLTIEPHTAFFKKQEALRRLLPDEQMSLRMYEMAMEKLPLAGLEPYEISAFAKNGDFSRHNVGYWTARPFLGFGPSAFSYWEGRRFRNVANLNKYCEALDKNLSPIDFDEQLTPQAQQRELFTVQMRLKEGVNLDIFEKRHGKLDAETIVTIDNLIEQGLIMRDNRRVALTHRGVLFYDTVASELI